MQKGITVRHEEEIVNLFMGLAAMNGKTGTDILRRSMEEYIEKHRGAGAEKLSGKGKVKGETVTANAETREAMAELRDGKGEKPKSAKKDTKENTPEFKSSLGEFFADIEDDSATDEGMTDAEFEAYRAAMKKKKDENR